MVTDLCVGGQQGTRGERLGRSAKIVGLKVCSLFRGRRGDGGVPVLAYHSVDGSGSYLSTSPAIFKAEIECLVRLGCSGVSVSKFAAMMDAGARPPERTVVLTFDDGLRNFLEAAWPVIRDAGFGATLYVPTAFVGKTSAWYADYGIDPMPALTWDELRRLRDEGTDIQGHGHSHRKLTSLAAHELPRELVRSRETLARELATDVAHFCYPFGDFNPEVRDAVQTDGYRTAVTTVPGRFCPGDDVFAMKRENLDMVTLEDEHTAEHVMRACVNGTFSMYIRSRDRILKALGRSWPQ